MHTQKKPSQSQSLRTSSRMANPGNLMEPLLRATRAYGAGDDATVAYAGGDDLEAPKVTGREFSPTKSAPSGSDDYIDPLSSIRPRATNAGTMTNGAGYGRLTDVVVERAIPEAILDGPAPAAQPPLQPQPQDAATASGGLREVVVAPVTAEDTGDVSEPTVTSTTPAPADPTSAPSDAAPAASDVAPTVQSTEQVVARKGPAWTKENDKLLQQWCEECKQQVKENSAGGSRMGLYGMLFRGPTTVLGGLTATTAAGSLSRDSAPWLDYVTVAGSVLFTSLHGLASLVQPEKQRAAYNRSRDMYESILKDIEEVLGQGFTQRTGRADVFIPAIKKRLQKANDVSPLTGKAYDSIPDDDDTGTPDAPAM